MSPSCHILFRHLRRARRGHLCVRLPDGSRHEFGGAAAGPVADLVIHDARAARRLLLSGDIGLGEAWMDQWLHSPDLTSLLSWFIANRAALAPAQPSLLSPLRWRDRLLHLTRHNNRRNSRRNIEAHYDLGNDFYAAFLDSSMTYSAAVFDQPGLDLEAAQENKYRHLAARLRLRPGDRVLEIGCGWGGFACFAARHFDCRVHGITLSPRQLQWAQARARRDGLADRVTFELRDYRDLSGTWDKIASIEMVEAVGHSHLPAFFRACRRSLKAGGVLALQAITIPDARYEAYRHGVDFIRKHVFPGGHLPSIGALGAASSAQGLQMRSVHAFGQHYAETLRRWRSRFDALGVDHGFGARFERLWRFYLCYCEAGFAHDWLDVIQATFAAPGECLDPLASQSLVNQLPGIPS